jgi:GTP-binding protein YchF
MALRVGIVGLPNVGKSTLFKALTKKQVDCANYPFCTIEPNIGVVKVFDERVSMLANLMNSKRKIYTTIEFVDIAGLVEGANKGEGLGNQFLANIREVDVILYVLRCFKDENVVNVRGKIDPWKDKEILDIEMILKDLATVSKSKDDLSKAKTLLEQGKVLSEENFSKEELELLKPYQLLTLKKRIYLLNGDEDDKFKRDDLDYFFINIKEELSAEGLSEEERKELGLSESKLDVLIKRCYSALNLITFLTTGEDETRAWTLKKGGTARDAGGVIHTDFKEKFIKAEVINWKKLYNAGTFLNARAKGLIRTEGKDYIVEDGDVIEIKI